MQLLSKTTKVYSHLSIADCKQYMVVKRAILASFTLTAKAYLESFRSVACSGSETYRLFLNRPKELQDYYTEAKQISLFEALKNNVLLEQFLLSLRPDI